MERKESNTNAGGGDGVGRISYYKGPISNLSPHRRAGGPAVLREATRAGINAEYQEKIARLREMYAEGDEDGSKEAEEHAGIT